MENVYVFNLANDHKWHQHLALLGAFWGNGQQTMTVYGNVCAEQNADCDQQSAFPPLQLSLFADVLSATNGGR